MGGVWSPTFLSSTYLLTAQLEDATAALGARPLALLPKKTSVEVGKGLLSGVFRNLGNLVQVRFNHPPTHPPTYSYE